MVSESDSVTPNNTLVRTLYEAVVEAALSLWRTKVNKVYRNVNLTPDNVLVYTLIF